MSPSSTSISPLGWALTPLSLLYSAGIVARNARYDRDPRASHAAAVPVISIGNITVGGTGKTPVVMETVRLLHEMGHKPAILTRGYGATNPNQADEVLEFRDCENPVPVIANPDRVAGARTAIGRHGATCLVLDDGFQHRRLCRDLDVVLIDALRPWGGGWVLPAGRLREPLFGLRRAGVFIITRANQVEPEEVAAIDQRLATLAGDTPVIEAHVLPHGALDLEENPVEFAHLAYDAILPVCGIGNPDTFMRMLAPLAGRLCPPLRFRDHQRYEPRHVARIIARAQRHGGNTVVTTRKDWVKLAPVWRKHAPPAAPKLVRLDVRMELQDEDGIFADCLQTALENHQ